MPTFLVPPQAPHQAPALDLFGDPLRTPTRRERNRVATVRRGSAPAAAPWQKGLGLEPATPQAPASPAPHLDPSASASASAPPALHPNVWRASELGRAHARCHASGFALLDAELPGGGWPTRCLTELLLPQAGCVEWRLLAPGVAPRAPGNGATPAFGGSAASTAPQRAGRLGVGGCALPLGANRR
jgi:hypothetical protein